MGKRVPWMLVCGGLIAGAVVIPLGPAAAAPTTVTIDGQQPWTDTGFEILDDQIIRITATGMINYCNGGPKCNATPDGSTAAENHCGGPSLCGALIGRISGGAPFAVGSDFEFSPQVNGTLELGINDFDEADSPNGVFDNNSGSFTAQLEVVNPEIKGRVVDELGNPVPDVDVETVSGGGSTAHTAPNGRYAIRLSKPGKYTVKASSEDLRDFKPKERIVNVTAQKAGKADFQAESQCSKSKSGPIKPRSGHYIDRNESPPTVTSLYYSCRSRRVVIAWEGRTNSGQLVGIRASGVVPKPTHGSEYRFAFTEGNGIFRFDGQFQGRESATWRVGIACGPSECESLRRHQGKWDSDVEGSAIADGITTGPPGGG